MVKRGHATGPKRVDFENSRPRFEVEILRASDLVRRESPQKLGGVQRPAFHLFVLYLKGNTTHTVDFEPHRCQRGTVISVQPGQLQQWRLMPGLEALILIFTPGFLFPERPRVGALWQERFFEDVAWPSMLRLHGAELRAMEGWFRRVEQTYASLDDGPLGVVLMRHLVSVVLLELARLGQVSLSPRADAAPGALARTRRFKHDLERSFRVTRAVGDYAAHLGCSSKTLDRACREMLGTSAKEFIDTRVALEARRLLAHTEMTVAAIGEELGFSEPTNFVKFFKANVGRLPMEFRRSVAR